MLKKIFTTVGLIIAGAFLAGAAYADNTLSVRLAQPKSPTNISDFNLTFVALDINSNPITVQCFKKGPSDGGFSQFGGNITLSNGGNTDNCPVNSSVMSQNGSYQFYVSATDGVNSATSSTVSVDFNTDGPGTPTNYSKNQTDSCTYKISFRTADDNGKTTKVEIYRSDSKSFSADSSTRVGTQGIGSNTDSTFTNVVGDCSKSYYFAVRAFDNSGNGSGLVGDSESQTTTTSTVATSLTTGAIPVANSNVSSGGENPTGTTSENQGSNQENKNTQAVEGAKTGPLTSRFVIIGFGMLAFAVVIGLYLFRKLKKA